MGFKFLHCGDLHLGCMPNHLDERYDDFFVSFKDLIDKADEEKCEYLLISGDLFHLKTINSKTLLSVTNAFDYAKSKGLKIIAIEGNHDKAFYVDEYSWLEYLHKRGFLTLLTHKIIDGKLVLDEDSIYEDDNIRIIGVGYLGVMTSEYLKSIDKQIKKSNKFTVLMLHAAIDRLCGQDMGDVDYKDLEPLKKVVDYVALGHIHVRYEVDDFCYNPGSIENIRIMDAKRKNDKGYYIVEVNNKEKNVNYYISKQRQIDFINIEVNKEQSIEEINAYLTNYPYETDKGSVLSISIYGAVSFNPYLINFEDIKNTIKEKFGLLYVEINNYINIITKENQNNEVTDIKVIEKEAIDNILTVNFPEVKDKNIKIKEVQDLKQALNNGEDLDYIIKNMIEEDVE